MRVTLVGLARAARYVDFPRPPYLPDVIKLLQERYNFVRVPGTPDEIIPTRETPGILSGLLHGKFVHEGRTIVIQSLSLYSDAVAIESPMATEEADIVLDDLLSIAPSVMTERRNQRAYASNLEFTLDVSLGTSFKMATAIGQAITKLFGTYTGDQRAFQLSSLKISTDPTKGSAEEFVIERRINTPFDANLYYSHAPLSTAHHITLLESIEKAMREAVQEASASPNEPPPPSSQSGSAS